MDCDRDIPWKGDIMNLEKCEKGHFYDGDLYAACPHCGSDIKCQSATCPFCGAKSITRPLNENETSVPNVIGMQFEEASSIAIAASLHLSMIDKEADEVILQEPLPGQILPKGSIINIVVRPSVGIDKSVGEISRAGIRDCSEHKGYIQYMFGEWNGKPITWRVLEVKADRALLISEDVLTLRQYHGKGRLYEFNGWVGSDIQAWLNNGFLHKAFFGNEEKSILSTYIPDIPSIIKNKVFLLSIDEAEWYFKDNEDRVALMATKNSPAMLWWLRSPGVDRYHAASVASNGNVNKIGDSVHCNYGVRPALIINPQLLKSQNGLR